MHPKIIQDKNISQFKMNFPRINIVQSQVDDLLVGNSHSTLQSKREKQNSSSYTVVVVAAAACWLLLLTACCSTKKKSKLSSLTFFNAISSYIHFHDATRIKPNQSQRKVLSPKTFLQQKHKKVAKNKKKS